MAQPTSRVRRGRRVLAIAGAVAVSITLAYLVAIASTGSSQLARAIVWLEADVDDIDRFPSRAIPASSASELPACIDDSAGQAFLRLDSVVTDDGSLEEMLSRTESSALLVLRQGVLVHEWYGEGSGRESLHTSFSMAKSFLSTLVGIAIAEGHISSVDDPVTDYIPELLDRDPRFGAITIENLLTMSSGIEYIELGTPWSDDATTYYSPDLRAAALAVVIADEPGETWLYNNYNPLLVGLVLERATGQSVSEFMIRALWGPLGAEAAASWSLDSDASGFEKMESGINARAIDYARFGLMVANGGVVDGTQVVPAQWLHDATAVDATSDPAEFYQYFWWVYPHDSASADFAARGNFGQYIYVDPEDDIVIVRLGRTTGDVDWPALLNAFAHEIGDADPAASTGSCSSAADDQAANVG